MACFKMEKCYRSSKLWHVSRWRSATGAQSCGMFQDGEVLQDLKSCGMFGED